MQAWAVSQGYTEQGTLGWLDQPVVAGDSSDTLICEPHKGTDYMCCALKSVVNISTQAACCALCKDEPQCTAWKIKPTDPSDT